MAKLRLKDVQEPKKEVKKEVVEKDVKAQDLKDGAGQPIVGIKSEKLGKGEIEGFDTIIKE